MKITIFLILTIATILLATLKTFTDLITYRFFQSDYLNIIFKHQFFALIIAIILVWLILKLNSESKVFLSMGKFNMLAEKEKWLGINGNSSWRRNGFQLLLFVSIPTFIFMFLAVKYTNNIGNFHWSFVPLIVLFSLSNSMTEELIFRFGIVGGFFDHFPKSTIVLISAILFGLPHFFGWPSGFVGVCMAGLLGYILCKSTIETKGLGIAFGIHFLQDIIIFTALFMMNVKSNNF